MIILNVEKLLKDKVKTKYWLFNKMNNIRLAKNNKSLSYTNFQNLIGQNNLSVRYQDLEDLCEALECDIPDILTLKKENKN